jgi:glucose/arabinose dehydrogenase
LSTVRGVFLAAAGLLLAATTPLGAREIGLELVADGLTHPTVMVSPPGDPRRFIAEQQGRIRILTPEGELLEEPFLDIRERLVDIDEGFDERGFTGLAFPPDYAESGRFYVYYSAPLQEGADPDWNHTARVSEFTVSADDPNRADPASERVVIEVHEPDNEHNAGALDFDRAGQLMIALGDGGLVGEDLDTTGQFSQRPDSLLGKILRLDVTGDPYAIPEDNPFVDVPGYRPEIFALGMRNPYRCTIDRGGTGALFCGDVGLAGYEEVNLVRPGGNYGWPLREGAHCYDNDDPYNHPATCDTEGLTDPIAEYVNCSLTDDNVGCGGRAVIGGYVYRGSAMPELDGAYLFGDWAASRDELGSSLKVAFPAPEGEMWPIEDLWPVDMTFDLFVLGFGQDDEGEVYVLASDTVGPEDTKGQIYKFVPPE